MDLAGLRSGDDLALAEQNFELLVKTGRESEAANVGTFLVETFPFEVREPDYDSLIDFGEGQLAVAVVRRSAGSMQGLEFEVPLVDDGAGAQGPDAGAADAHATAVGQQCAGGLAGDAPAIDQGQRRVAAEPAQICARSQPGIGRGAIGPGETGVLRGGTAKGLRQCRQRLADRRLTGSVDLFASQRDHRRRALGGRAAGAQVRILQRDGGVMLGGNLGHDGEPHLLGALTAQVEPHRPVHPLAVVGDLAQALGLSVRNLQRQLAAEGTSWSQLVDAARRDALQSLVRKGLPLGEAAERMGYHDASSLSRAARRWFGMPPAKWARTRKPDSTS